MQEKVRSTINNIDCHILIRNVGKEELSSSWKSKPLFQSPVKNKEGSQGDGSVGKRGFASLMTWVQFL